MKHITPNTDKHGIHQLTELDRLEATGGWDTDRRPETDERDYWYETHGEMPYSVWLRGVDEETRR